MTDDTTRRRDGAAADRERTEAEGSSQAEEPPVCASCGDEISVDDLVCPHCGESLVAG